MKVEQSVSRKIQPSPILEELRPLIHGMCRHPVKSELNNQGGTLRVQPHPEDYRIVCGVRGKVIRALNVLARAAASTDGQKRAYVELQEPDERMEGPGPQWPFEQKVDFDVLGALAKIRRIYTLATGRPCVMNFNRDVDQLNVKINGATLIEEYIVTALDDVFYPWGYSNGCLIKIKGS